MTLITIKDFLKDYARLKVEEKKIKKLLEDLNPVIKKAMIDKGIDKVPTSAGNFSIKKKKNWTYSLAVENAKKELDSLKANEEADGTATFVEVEQLEFRENKSDE